MRVAIVLRGVESLFDRPRRCPALQVRRRTGLVIGARGPRPTERLLTDDCACWLVVDVEVTGREPKFLACPGDDIAVLGDDRPGQGVRRERLHLRYHFLEVAVLVDMHGEDRPEVLSLE